MEDFFKMDVFFVVATVVTVVIGVLIAVLLGYAIRILRTVNRVAETVEEEADRIRADIQEARGRVKNFKLLHLFPLLTKSAKRLTTKAKKRKED